MLIVGWMRSMTLVDQLSEGSKDAGDEGKEVGLQVPSQCSQQSQQRLQGEGSLHVDPLQKSVQNVPLSGKSSHEAMGHCYCVSWPQR